MCARARSQVSLMGLFLSPSISSITQAQHDKIKRKALLGVSVEGNVQGGGNVLGPLGSQGNTTNLGESFQRGIRGLGANNLASSAAAGTAHGSGLHRNGVVPINRTTALNAVCFTLT